MAAELSGASSAAHYETVRSALNAAFDFAQINAIMPVTGGASGAFPFFSCRDRRSALPCPGGGFKQVLCEIRTNITRCVEHFIEVPLVYLAAADGAAGDRRNPHRISCTTVAPSHRRR